MTNKSIKSLNEIANQLVQHQSHFARMVENIGKFVPPPIEYQKEVNKMMERVDGATKRIIEAQKLLNGFRPKFSINHEIFKSVLAEVESVPESIKLLAEQGWYVAFDMTVTELNRVSSLLKDNETDQVDYLLARTFDEELMSILKFLTESFPHRSEAIRQAIDAHSRQNYFLSIPCFFSQTEGICKEAIGVRFFKTENSVPVTAKWVEEYQAEGLFKALLEPLIVSGNVRGFQVKGSPVGINRHDVLHGDSYDYGNDPVNSYKALSLLNYIGTVVTKLKN
ncbi:MAG: hypothetical protein AB7O48_04015 [Cyclobacteriaceae bacterium]